MIEGDIHLTGRRILSWRMLFACAVLLLGWIALIASMPMVVSYDVDPWKGIITPLTGLSWAEYEVGPKGTFLLFSWPHFLGILAGTIWVLVPVRKLGRALLWVLRISAVGACETWLMVQGQPSLMSYLSHNGDRGITYLVPLVAPGFPFFVGGSTLIGLSVWLVPVFSVGASARRGQPAEKLWPRVLRWISRNL